MQKYSTEEMLHIIKHMHTTYTHIIQHLIAILQVNCHGTKSVKATL